MFTAITFTDQVSQVRAMKARNVFVRITKLKLAENVMPHPLGGARSKRRNGTVWKRCSETLQLTIFGAEFMSPFRDTVSFVNGKKCDGNPLQPIHGVGTRQAFRREI